MTSMRRNDVASTSFRRHVPNRFLINHCQIITFLILKYDIIENPRIELRGIVLPVQVGGLLGGGQRVCWPPSQIIGGAWPPLFLRLWIAIFFDRFAAIFTNIVDSQNILLESLTIEDRLLYQLKIWQME